MTTPLAHIAGARDGLGGWLQGKTPTEQLADLDEARTHVQDLEHEIAIARAESTKALVAELGGTAAAKQLGISRNRVYELMRGPAARKS